MHRRALIAISWSVFFLTNGELKSVEVLKQPGKNQQVNSKKRTIQDVHQQGVETSKNEDLSPQEQWYKDADNIAKTWGQDLEGLISDAHKFLKNYQKMHPDKRQPFITELAVYPKSSYANDSQIRKFSVPIN